MCSCFPWPSSAAAHSVDDWAARSRWPEPVRWADAHGVTPVSRAAAVRSWQPDVRHIETEHFVYHAVQPRRGRLYTVHVEPVSAAAKYWATSTGESLDVACAYANLGALMAHHEARLAAHWGPYLDSRREWGG